MAWQTGTASDHQDLLDKLIAFATNRHVSAAAVNSGGTGYVVGDILTVAGGTVVQGLTATIEVTSVAAGVIDGVKVYTAGAYSADPTTTANAVTGGTGAGATIDLTMADTGWTSQRDATAGSPSEREWIAEGVGSGADQIFVGVRTIRDTGAGAFNWELAGFTGFNAGSVWGDQSGFSGSTTDTYVPLANQSIQFWLSVTGRRMLGVFRIGTTYQNMYLGFLNPFATPTELPYPLYVGGTSTYSSEVFSNSTIFMSGMCDPIAYTGAGGSDFGPAAYRGPDGTWYSVKNSQGSSSRSASENRVIYPCGKIAFTGATPEDNFLNNVPNFTTNLIPSGGVPGSATGLWLPTPDTGGDITNLVPTILAQQSPGEQVYGELDDVYWMSSAGNNVVSEDTLIINGERYFAFQNCNRSDSWAYFAIKQG